MKHWLVGNSLLFMVVMAMDRYRRVCFPFSTQFTQQAAKYLILGFSSFSLLLSVRYFGTADIVRNNLTLDVNATKGHHCSLSETELLQSIENIFHWIDICVHALIIVSLIVFYSLVVRKVVLSKRKLKSHDKISILNSRKGSNAAHTICSTSGVVETQITHDGSSGLNDTNTITANNRNTVSKPEVSTENHSGVSDNTISYRISHFFQKPKLKHHMSASARAEMKITLMVAMITLASVLCFVPYYLAMLLISSNMSGDGLILSVGNALLRRTYMLNSAINPFIMAFYNEPFRLFIRQKLTCNCKKEK
jgi:hypothetical protein